MKSLGLGTLSKGKLCQHFLKTNMNAQFLTQFLLWPQSKGALIMMTNGQMIRCGFDYHSTKNNNHISSTKNPLIG